MAPKSLVGTAGCVVELLPERDQDNKEGVKVSCYVWEVRAISKWRCKIGSWAYGMKLEVFAERCRCGSFQHRGGNQILGVD